VKVVYGDGVDLEIQGLARGQASGNQVLHDLLLAVDHDCAARQLLEVDPVAEPGKVKVNTPMRQPLLHHARAHAGIVEHGDALMLENSCPHTVFDVVPTFCFQDDGLDTVLMQEVGQQQACRPRADDGDLCTHQRYTVSRGTHVAMDANAF